MEVELTTPLISVLLPVYNQVRYVGYGLESILTQTFGDFELLIVDDGSTDGSSDIISRYSDPRIRVIRNQTNIGLAPSLNRGMAAARGKYLARQDADDISLPERFAKEVTYLEAHPDVALLGTGADIIDDNGNFLWRPARPSTDVELKWEMLSRNPFFHTSVMFRRRVVDKVGGYTTDPVIFRAFVEDYDLWSRVAQVGRVFLLPEPLVQYRIYPNNSSARTRAAQDEQLQAIASRNVCWVMGWNNKMCEDAWRIYERFWRHPLHEPLDMDNKEAQRITEFLLNEQDFFQKYAITPDERRLYRRRYYWPWARHAMALSVRQNGCRDLACRLTLFILGLKLTLKRFSPGNSAVTQSMATSLPLERSRRLF
jgi:glycosyltransferase involved in cell wall biosynthesis